MADTLTLGSYTFGDGLRSFDPGVPDALDHAIEAWDYDPTPRNWPFVTMHDRVTRIITHQIREATEAEARAELAVIAAECVPGAELTWLPDGQSGSVSCKVLSCDIDTPSFDPTTLVTMGQGRIDIVITCRTTPYWVGAPVETVVTVPAGTPWVATVEDVPGDTPALTSVRYTHAQATTGLAVGLKSDAGAGYDPSDDYDTTTGGSWESGGKYDAITMTGTATTIGTPGSKDVGVHKGDYLVWARVLSYATTAADAFFRAVSSVQGAIGSAASVYGREVSPTTTSGAGYDVLDLGVVPLPAGRVQAGLSGTAYAPATRAVNQDTGTTEITSGSYTQTYTAVNTGRVSSIEIYGRVPVGVAEASISIVDPTTLIFGNPLVVGKYRCATVSTAAGWHVFTRDVGYGVVSSGTQYQISGVVASNVIPSRSTSSTYASGACSAGGDLRFRVWEQKSLTLGATIGIQARCTESSKVARLDTVALIPTDEAAITVSSSFSAGQGVVIDNLSDDEADHDVYVCDSTDSGVSVLSSAAPYGGPLLLRPGSNTLSGMAKTPATAAPGDASLIVTYRPRWRIPFTGV